MDIVDGDNAAEIAGGQRGLMMMLLASERASEWSELLVDRDTTVFSASPFATNLPPPFPRLHNAPSPLPASSSPRPSHYPSFSNRSDIACGVVPVAASLPTNQSPLPINPLYISPL